jgi:hypothetical protein
MFHARPIWAFLACALVLNAVPGTTIQTDLSSTVDDGGYVVANGPLAQSFTPTAAYTLTTVIVDLTNQPFPPEEEARPSKMRGATKPATAFVGKKGPSVTPYTVATLYADSANSPGTVLAVSSTQISDSLLTSTPQQFTFTFSYPVAANTRYWIGLSSPNSSTAFWSGSDSAGGTDVTTESYEFTGHIFPVQGEGDAAFLLGVFGTPSSVPGTPAPATIWLTLLGLGCAAFYVRRKRLAA